MKDRLEEFNVYKLSMELWDEFWGDSEVLMKDVRGRELSKQLTKSVGSIAATIEEGFGRGYGKEFPQFMRISRGSARESKGHYLRSKFLLNKEIIEKRVKKLDEIIAKETKTIQTLEKKIKDKSNLKNI